MDFSFVGRPGVIWESRFWKDDLLKAAKSIRGRMQQRRWPDVSSARCEQTIMIAFYSIRKLIEAQKLSDSILSTGVPVTIYPKKMRAKVHYYNRYDIDRCFNLNRGESQTKSLAFVCNQVVHSYVFCLLTNEAGNLEAITVCSDRDRKNSLIRVDANVIAELLERVGSCYPHRSRVVYDPSRGDYKITQN
jgi:hypothetical protein